MRTFGKSAAFALVMAATLAVVACKSDTETQPPPSGGHTSPYPSCNEIVSTCHQVDVGEGPIHDCHDQGHGAKSDADCSGIKDHCLEICRAALADAGPDGGH